MSRFPLFDIGRDVSVAVGAYIGIARDQFWSWLANDGYSLRLAEAVKRFEAADRLAEKEAEEEVAEPAPMPGRITRPSAFVDGELRRYHNSPACSSGHCVCGVAKESSPAADEDTASAGSPSFSGLSGGADWARGSSRAATAAGEPTSQALAAAAKTPPEVEPKSPQASAPSGGSLIPDDLVVGDPLACAIRDATQGNPNGMQVVCFVTDKYWEDRRVFTMTGWQWDDDILCTNWVEPAKDLQRLLDWPSHNAGQ